MKALFPGYYRLEPSEYKAIWSSALIVTDANVLLNLYRYSPDAARTLRTALDHCASQLWLPYQAAQEFHHNRLKEIPAQTKKYHDACEKAKSLVESLRHLRQHPFVSETTLASFSDAVDSLCRELTQTAEQRREFLRSDEILDYVTKLFDGRTGSEPDEDQLPAREKEAARLCGAEKAPGALDAKKDANALGDTYLWMEVMECAKSQKRPIVLVTDDRKSDWWLSIDGETVGLQPKLVRSFIKATGQRILAYDPQRFVQYALEREKEQVPAAVLDEMASFSQDHSCEPPADVVAHDLREIGLHLNRHRSSARRLLKVLNSVPSTEWRETMSGQLSLPSGPAKHAEDIISSEPCLAYLCQSLLSIPDSFSHVLLAHVRPTMSAEEYKLLHGFWHLPKVMKQYVASFEPL